MPVQESIRHIDFVINDHRIEGWADDDPPYEFPVIEFLNKKYGHDGTLYVSDSGMQGGEVMLKLLPNSRSTKQILRWVAMIQRGARLTFSGTLTDPELLYSVTMRGGFLFSSQAATSVNRTFEPVFEFEQVLPDYDSAAFDAPPTVS